MTPLLRLSYKEPRYLQAMIKRWYKALRLSHWTIDIEMADGDDMENRSDEHEVMAEVSRVIPHRRAKIKFNVDLSQVEAEWYVVHELRHLSYAEIEQVFYQAWNDLGGKMSFIHAHGLLMDKLEELCERDAKILLDLTGRRNAN